jgi:hypothetical protein
LAAFDLSRQAGGWNPKDKVHFPRICNNEVWSSADGKTWILEKPNTFSYDGKTFNRHLNWEGRHTAGYADADRRGHAGRLRRPRRRR